MDCQNQESVLGSHRSASLPSEISNLGFLEKKGKTNKAYKRRFWKLKNNSLVYFADASEDKIKGQINLDNPEVIIEDSSEKEFQIKTSGRTYYLRAETTEEKCTWLKILRSLKSGSNTTRKMRQSVAELSLDMRVFLPTTKLMECTASPNQNIQDKNLTMEPTNMGKSQSAPIPDLKKGNLMKKKRYGISREDLHFELKGMTLNYKNSKGKKKKIQLKDCTIHSGDKASFQICIGSRKYDFVAPTIEDRDDWIDHLTIAKKISTFLSDSGVLESDISWHINDKDLDDCTAISHFLLTNSTLTELDVSFNKIDDNGVEMIVKGLKLNSTLKILNLSRNKIKDDGGKYISSLLRVNYTLLNLDISKNPLTNTGIITIMDGLSQNSSLTSLALSHIKINNDGQESIVQALKINRTLSNLNLSKTGMDVKGLLLISNLIKNNSILTSLNLSQNKIKDKGAKMIADALKKNSNLNYLNLKGNWIHDKGINAFVDTLKTNSTLSKLAINNEIPVGAFRDETKDLDVSVKHYNDNDILIFASLLRVNLNITSLNISKNKIKDNGAIALAKSIKNNTSLVYLNIQGNQIGMYGAKEFANTFETNTFLVKMIFNGEIPLKKLRNGEMKVLSLSNKGYNNDDIIIVNSMLKRISNLELFAIDCNNIGDTGTHTICEALKIHSQLKELHLYDNNIGDSGSSAIGEILKNTSTLTLVLLYRNNITDSGAIHIGEGLKRNNSVTEAWLSTNKIANKGAEVLSEMLMKNTTLKKLFLHHNLITDIGIDSIIKALKINTIISRCELTNNEISISKKESLQNNKQTNSSLKRICV